VLLRNQILGVETFLAATCYCCVFLSINTL